MRSGLTWAIWAAPKHSPRFSPIWRRRACGCGLRPVVLGWYMTHYGESDTSQDCERPLEGSVGTMNKSLRVGLGLLLVLVGLIWTLQGLGVISGSVMTGVTLWAIIGPIVTILGLWLVAKAARAG